MKTVRWMAIVGLVWVACHAQAAVISYTSFDVGVQSPAPDPYPGAPGDVLAGSTNVRHNNVNISSSTGPQGGQALQQLLGASWPNTQGYTFGNLPTNAPAGGSGPGKFVAVEYTIEAFMKPNFTDTGFGLSTRSTIFDSSHLGDGSFWGDVSLYVDQNTGQVQFAPSTESFPGGPGFIASTINLQAGQWYQIAAVVRTSGVQRTELWINNQLARTGTYPSGYQTQDSFRIPGYFNIASFYWPVSQMNRQGEIDALAISNVALDPYSFAIPEPTAGALLGLGDLLLAAGWRKRSA